MSLENGLLLTQVDVVFVMGVSACGKTTVGSRVAASLEWSYKDADEFHSLENITKMRLGVPLTDDDRMPWLTAINAYCKANRRTVLGCSALKKSYRNRLRDGIRCCFVFLNVSRSLLEKRLRERRHPYMPPCLLDSQLATLEDPSEEEDVITVDIHEEVDLSILTDTIIRRLFDSF